MVLKQERRVNAASVAKRQSISAAAAQKKLEIEAVYDCGFDFLVHFLVGRIVGSGNAVRRACARAR